jgi:hypothetical protein
LDLRFVFLHLLPFHHTLVMCLLGQLEATAPTRPKHDDISLNVPAFGPRSHQSA